MTRKKKYKHNINTQIIKSRYNWKYPYTILEKMVDYTDQKCFSCMIKGNNFISFFTFNVSNFKWLLSFYIYFRFNSIDFLEKYRNKKISFVGDSLSNNMWRSLICMLHSAVPNSNYTFGSQGLLSTFSLPVCLNDN